MPLPAGRLSRRTIRRNQQLHRLQHLLQRHFSQSIIPLSVPSNRRLCHAGTDYRLDATSSPQQCLTPPALSFPCSLHTPETRHRWPSHSVLDRTEMRLSHSALIQPYPIVRPFHGALTRHILDCTVQTAVMGRPANTRRIRLGIASLPCRTTCRGPAAAQPPCRWG